MGGCNLLNPQLTAFIIITHQVDVRYQRVEQLLTLQGSPTTPVIYFGEGPYGYIADSTSASPHPMKGGSEGV